MLYRSRALTAFVAAGLVATACGSDGDDTTFAPATVSTTSSPASVAPTTGTSTSSSTASTTRAPSGARPLSDVELRATPVGSATAPIVSRRHPVTGRQYVATKTGQVLDLAAGRTVLDLRGSVSGGGEQGLLGIAFSDDGSLLFVSYTDDDGDSQIVEYPFDDGDADDANPRALLSVAQPFSNHNGGDIHVGPDGHLWIALGDGGSAGDPQDHGQNPNTLLGSILRIDPANPSEGRAYGIPGDNPFVDGGGQPEIWLFGVRNPWRIGFDPANGDLWVADVGQNAWEEINVLPASTGRGRGAHLGWDHFEGTHRFEGGDPGGTTPPVYEYDHSEGCSITGGFVYRGSAIPELGGAYLFADFCRGDLRAIRSDGTTATEYRSWNLGIDGTYSFAQDAGGELLVLTSGGTIFRVDRA